MLDFSACETTQLPPPMVAVFSPAGCARTPVLETVSSRRRMNVTRLCDHGLPRMFWNHK